MVPDPTTIDPSAAVFLTYMPSPGDIRRPLTTGTGLSASPITSESYTYDSFSRLASKGCQLSGRPSLNVGYSYDALGAVTDVTYPPAYGLPLDPQRNVHFDYDLLRRISNVKVDKSDYASHLVYNPASQLTSVTLPVGQPQAQL